MRLKYLQMVVRYCAPGRNSVCFVLSFSEVIDSDVLTVDISDGDGGILTDRAVIWR